MSPTKHPVVAQFERGEVTAEEALKQLGLEMASLKTKRASTAHLQAAVNQVLGMDDEPDTDPSADPAWAEAYRNRRG